MKAFRLCPARFRESVLSGAGASSRDGARWNHPGVAVVYLGGSKSLCLLEYLAHVGEMGRGPKDLVMFEFELPDKSIARLPLDALPEGWDALPPGIASQEIGTRFLKSAGALAMAVPSVIVPDENNFVLNPRHALAQKLIPVSEEPIKWDARIAAAYQRNPL